MDKTNKITITCEDWETRMDITRAVADILGIYMLDVDDYVIYGSVMNGDIENNSKDEFIQKYGKSVFMALETITYIAYVDTVDEPFVISLGYDTNDGNVDTFKKTISVNVSDNPKDIYSLISDYTVKQRETISATAKNIVDIITSDKRWKNL
jgi:hypothetical protein